MNSSSSFIEMSYNSNSFAFFGAVIKQYLRANEIKDYSTPEPIVPGITARNCILKL